MKWMGYAAVLGLTIVLSLPLSAGTGDYRTDFDFPGHGDAWYGRYLSDTRRDFPANPVDRVSDGDDFGRGYLDLVARAGFGPPLQLTETAANEYVFRHGSQEALLLVDCDGNGIDDQCDLDCGPAAGPCDVLGCGTATDCDINGIPDTCDIGTPSNGCVFPQTLSENTTAAADSVFLGPPDNVYRGLGGQIVTYQLDCAAIVDGPGPDFNIYEVGGAEYGSIDVYVSDDGVNFVNINEGQTPRVPIPGDLATGAPRGFDIRVGGLGLARYVRIDGVGTGSDGTSTGFDLDAIGILNGLGNDCDANGTLDVCQTADDCNGNQIPETCEFALGIVEDCDLSGTPDTCDTLGGANDCDGDRVPDSCEPDCNANATPDDCDLLAATSTDCNLNVVPDECDLATSPVDDGTTLFTIGGNSARTWTQLSPPAAATDVLLNVDAHGDFDASNEYVDVLLNGFAVGRLFDAGGQNCATTLQTLIIPAATFNNSVAGGNAVWTFVAPTSVNATECGETFLDVSVVYTPVLDCNANATVDSCDIGAMTSFDVNLNGLPDECETDCNTNGTPDDYDISQGISLDCNTNGVPDECDVASATSDDCDSNGIPDECEADCNANGINDVCDIASMTSGDCDLNGIPDECDIGTLPNGCVFPRTLSENTTAAADSVFLGPPDNVYRGLGGQIVTYDLDCAAIVDGLGPDFNIYEVGGAEYGSIDVYVSGDGVNFVNINEGRTPRVPIAGDLSTGAPRGFDLAATDLRLARYVRIDGVGTGNDGASTGFDLDAIGVINGLGNDCDANGTLDACQTADDCNGNRVPESCEFLNNWVDDCDSSGTPDTCDTQGGVNDCDGDSVPDLCEADCNTNITPDECEIAAMTAADCNGNVVPDECDLGISSVNRNVDLVPIGGEIPRTWTILSPPPAATDVSMNFFGFGNFASSIRYIDVLLNGVSVGRIFETGAFDCAGSFEGLIVPAATYNFLVAGTDAVWTLDPSPQVSATLCTPTSLNVTLFYNAIVDCNTNTTVDSCDIDAMTSFDVNVNGLPDECEADCNTNGVPDDWDISQGTSPDCNANGVPDECDIASMSSDDCDGNGIPDECEADCNANGINDVCDIASMTSGDCDLNGLPDECDLVFGTVGCSFPDALLDNSTIDADATFLGAPDGVYFGLGGQIVTYAFGCGFVLDGPGPDFNVYEVSTGSPEFGSLGDVLVSADGVTFVSVKASEGAVVRIPGDSAHTSDNFARSYDFFDTGLKAVRYVRLDGAGTGASGTGTGFDLDAIGAIHTAGLDCDSTGVLDRCEAFADCNVNEFPDACEIALGVNDDCDANGTADSCDIAAGAQDIDADWIPDACEPDCNGNMLPDDYDIAQGTENDCNDNLVPDACDLASGTSNDCNLDGLPDDCPVCPTVEVTFVMDTSSSMTDEGAALCNELQQVVAELQIDLVNVDTELLGILATGGATFPCLTDTVGNLYGTAVPGSPAPGQEILGEPCGANLNEDWGPATAIVAGLKPWLPDSVRLIVPISDEGPRCGNPVNDPGDDRDSILNAIGRADANDVIVSPIAGTGSNAGVIAMGNLIAGATGGQAFESTDPSLDLAQAIRDIIVDACFERGDCNANTIPDTCDLDAMTSNDCDMSGRPDECENDCNANGLEDSCDIAAMTSADGNLNGVPDECEGITLTAGPTDWSWTGVASALGYDLLRGDLIDLLGSTGDFSTSTDQCLVNDHAALDWPLGADPGPGQAFWYLVRGVIGSGPLSYDVFSPRQAAPRDAGVTASGNDCP